MYPYFERLGQRHGPPCPSGLKLASAVSPQVHPGQVQEAPPALAGGGGPGHLRGLVQ